MVISASPQTPSGGEKSTAATSEPQTPASAVPSDGSSNVPLVDPVVLQDLEHQLGQPDLATNFAKDYVGLWEQRERRLMASLAHEDRAAALDAAISLKVSSTMVGARRLAGLAQALESAVRGGDLSGGSVRELISVHGRATVEELQAQYLQHRG
ncbi:HPt (histidine-containing phosphotransfer) domain-containing protein [Pseudarthrobacter sp. W1I19]|uniref:Hpt domain-containing protein n=1 Tax=Pseudarthrobacter sp. W1I19 TaxID=3042288 RepID=UPI0027811F16|nr:Hpt domain-containing protein [Pseudarthrobacter sp. W1I19]MDQ0925667.1 HPt (histidine-containing phosphotransfer) domain-containing protein [Pseudarthrobacter sp. W1I19]